MERDIDVYDGEVVGAGPVDVALGDVSLGVCVLVGL